MALTLEKLSRKALAAGAARKKKTLGKGWASKPAASAMPLSDRDTRVRTRGQRFAAHIVTLVLGLPSFWASEGGSLQGSAFRGGSPGTRVFGLRKAGASDRGLASERAWTAGFAGNRQSLPILTPVIKFSGYSDIGDWI
jgi:hypothetical protein